MTFRDLDRRIGRLEGPKAVVADEAAADAEFEQLIAELAERDGPEAAALLSGDATARTETVSQTEFDRQVAALVAKVRQAVAERVAEVQL